MKLIYELLEDDAGNTDSKIMYAVMVRNKYYVGYKPETKNVEDAKLWRSRRGAESLMNELGSANSNAFQKNMRKKVVEVVVSTAYERGKNVVAWKPKAGHKKKVMKKG